MPFTPDKRIEKLQHLIEKLQEDQAFELAGARSLVMSLWRVPSGPTRELMQEFYRQLSLGKRRSQALREAQRIIRRRYPETFYWGAFVLSGDSASLQL